MELQGHWEPGVMQGLTDDGQGLGDKTGWFPFPAVDGGAGRPDGRRSAVATPGPSRRSAPDEAVDFVKYLLSDEVQKGFAENDMGLPTNPAAAARCRTRPSPSCSRCATRRRTSSCTSTRRSATSVGGAMNDEIALLFAGEASPQDVVDATPAGRRRRRSELTVTDRGAARDPRRPSSSQAAARRAAARRAARRPVGAGLATAPGDRCSS